MFDLYKFSIKYKIALKYSYDYSLKSFGNSLFLLKESPINWNDNILNGLDAMY